MCTLSCQRWGGALPALGTTHQWQIPWTYTLSTCYALCLVLCPISEVENSVRTSPHPVLVPFHPNMGSCGNRSVGIRVSQSKGQKWKECSQVSPASPPGSLPWASWVFLLRRRTGFLLSVTVWKVALCQLCSPLSEEKASEQRHRKPDMSDSWKAVEQYRFGVATLSRAAEI